MKKTAFIATVLGIFILLILMNVLPYKQVGNAADLEGLVSNQKVEIQGLVSSERLYEEELVMNISGIKVVCGGCKEGYLGSEVFLEGIINDYNGKVEIRVLTIEIID